MYSFILGFSTCGFSLNPPFQKLWRDLASYAFRLTAWFSRARAGDCISMTKRSKLTEKPISRLKAMCKEVSWLYGYRSLSLCHLVFCILPVICYIRVHYNYTCDFLHTHYVTRILDTCTSNTYIMCAACTVCTTCVIHTHMEGLHFSVFHSIIELS